MLIKMSKKLAIIFFSFLKKIIFDDLSYKFKPGSFKKSIDFLFRIFEKIVHNFDFVTNEYLNIYNDMVNNEIKLANLSSNDSVLVIGCGSIPSTPVIVEQKIGVKIVGIDIDKNAVRSAKRIINNLNLTDKIKIKQVNGLDYSVKEFDVIFILYGVTKPAEFLKYLSDKIKSGTKVIIRLHSNSFEEQFNMIENFEIFGKTKSQVLGQIYSYLLVKK